MQTDIQNVRDCTGYNGKQSKYHYVDSHGLARNYLLEQQVQQQKQNDKLFTIPTILINDVRYSGGLKCSKLSNLTSAACPVVNALCHAFADTAKPPACKKDFNWYAIETNFEYFCLVL